MRIWVITDLLEALGAGCGGGAGGGGVESSKANKSDS